MRTSQCRIDIRHTIIIANPVVNKLSNAAKSDVVDLGLNVHLKNITKKKEETYRIVGSAEADPFNNLISNESPIGKGLLKHKVGETVSIDIPSGKTVKYKILKISK